MKAVRGVAVLGLLSLVVGASRVKAAEGDTMCGTVANGKIGTQDYHTGDGSGMTGLNYFYHISNLHPNNKAGAYLDDTDPVHEPNCGNG